MKSFVCVLWIICLFTITACKHKSTHTAYGYLQINNHSSAVLHILMNGQTTLIPARSSHTFTCDVTHSGEVSYTFYGDLVKAVSQTITVFEDVTATVDVEADCAQYTVTNSTAGNAWVTIAGVIDHYNLPPQVSHVFQLHLNHEYESFFLRYGGDYLLPDSTNTTLCKDSLYVKELTPNCGRIEVFNTCTWIVHDLYIAPQGSSNWSNDLMESYINLNQSFFLQTAPGSWRLKAIDNDNIAWIQNNVDVVNNATTTVCFPFDNKKKAH